MDEENKAQFRNEGDPAFETDTENDNSADSQSGEETEGEGNDGQGEGDGQHDDKIPFHEHPRWKERENEWNNRFNDQEARHKKDLEDLRKEFSGARKENTENTEIPPWFGGDQKQWDEYRKYEDDRLSKAEERAVEKLTKAKEAEDKAVKDATDYMESEIKAIEADKDLNPSGSKIDPNKLLKFVLDNELIDSKGRWNYRAGWKFMNAGKPSPKQQIDEKKKIAGATGTDHKGEKKPAPYKTSADFKKNKPW